MVSHCCIFFSSFYFFKLLFYLENYNKMVLNEIWDSAERWHSQLGKHRNSYWGREQAWITLLLRALLDQSWKGWSLVAEVHEGERKIWCNTKHATRIWNVKNMNKGTLEIIKHAVGMSKHCSVWCWQNKKNWNGTFPVRQLQSVLLWKCQTQKNWSGINSEARCNR